MIRHLLRAKAPQVERGLAFDPFGQTVLSSLLSSSSGEPRSLATVILLLSGLCLLVFGASFLLDQLTRPVWGWIGQVLWGPESFASRRRDLLATSLGSQAEGCLLVEVSPALPFALAGPWTLVLTWLSLVGPALSVDALACRPILPEHLPGTLLPWFFPALALRATRSSPVSRLILLPLLLLGLVQTLINFHLGRAFWTWQPAVAPGWVGGLLLLSLLGGLGLVMVRGVWRRESALIASDRGLQIVVMDRWGDLDWKTEIPWSQVRLRRHLDAFEIELDFSSESGGARFLMGVPEGDSLLLQARARAWTVAVESRPRSLSRASIGALPWLLALSLVHGGALGNLAYQGAQESILRHPTSLPEEFPEDPRPNLRNVLRAAQGGTLSEIREELRHASLRALRTRVHQGPWRELWMRQIRDLRERLEKWEAAALRDRMDWEPEGESRRHYLHALRAFTTPQWIEQPGAERRFQGRRNPAGRQHLLEALDLDPEQPLLVFLVRLLALEGEGPESPPSPSHPIWKPDFTGLEAAASLAIWSQESEQAFWWTLLNSPPLLPSLEVEP